MQKSKMRFPHEPEFVVTPGEILQETIDALGLTQVALAARLGLARKTVNRIIRGEEPISHDTALRLERVTNTPARFWNNLESCYREKIARKADQARAVADVEWLKTIPTKELIERGAIDDQTDPPSLLQVVLRFFGVNSPQEWRPIWGKFAGSFRKSEAFPSRLGPLSTWLRLGELEGRKVVCAPYSRSRFRESLDEIRRLTLERPEVFVPRMKSLCASAGVAFVLVPEIKGAPVSGAACWLSPEKALIQMTLRGKTDDHFWFTFFHEACHVLEHSKKERFVDDGEDGDEREAEANRFAAELLIPRSRANELRGLENRPQIVEFARSLGIAPGIVLGRLQKEGLADYRNRDNDLKVRLRWAEGGSGVTVSDGGG